MRRLPRNRHEPAKGVRVPFRVGKLPVARRTLIRQLRVLARNAEGIANGMRRDYDASVFPDIR